MTFRASHVRDALEVMGVGQYDDAVSAALVAIGVQPFSATQVQDALVAAKLPHSMVLSVMDYLDETDPEKQRGFALKLRSRIEAARLAAEAEPMGTPGMYKCLRANYLFFNVLTMPRLELFA